ncbi:MAG: hypothetical protein UBAL2_80490325 [Leptospirillum rubarum]|jgi:hypothetical protein|nr:MAG: hypothetical protein UBAL2_80490325 [Leptospirillum rubarum]
MARIPVRDPGDWAFAMGRLPVRFQETEQSDPEEDRIDGSDRKPGED